ncbi:TetR/AcrR family transcriptional regulator [Gordonia hankookensis]|uniref:TetR/AcrR family transcriptional regulator n=1 Tax=Gordonia hankookensis TaxID=589403 RepID=A0ABR7WGE2_9ACTN|nr:TetR/AcrR family transcriptional regulator [Gordonia hankookensis]MBD1321848.1 TetR/AcrR family transcriptional regulator [Gordonia hankookensis]NDZ95238.1 TetR/AcrR family transcriptional regulator [Streptomyces sp. SID11726]NEB24342.1 TetR/AcrR family transcriptional regulator [Streptomyces sp. SID6673]
MAKSSVNTPTAPVDSLSPRGRATRDSLLDAATRVFERVGFLDARVELIAQEAEVSYGTFYRYFESKEEIFRELSTRLFVDVHLREPSAPGHTPAERLIASNRAYYQAYRRNARMMAIVEQVATFNAEFRELRHQHRAQWIDRTAAAIRRWQDEGRARAALDPTMAARAMAAMVDHSLYLWLVQGEDADETKLLDTLDQMCLGALGLDNRG